MSVADDLLSRLEESIAAAVASGDRVREKVSAAVSDATGKAAAAGAKFGDVAEAAVRGARAGADKATAGSPMREAVQGVGEGFERAALGAKLALQEARSRGFEQAEQQGAALLEGIRNGWKAFTDGLGDLREHAGTSGDDIRARLDRAVGALADELKGSPGSIPGVDAAKKTAGTLFESLGEAIRRAGRALDS